MLRDVGDILDRWSIAKLKNERIRSEEAIKEFKAFEEAVNKLPEKYPEVDWKKFKEFIYSINDDIWQLEAGLKSGKDSLSNPHYIFDEINNKALARIGIITILIRNFNHLRVNLKNLINSICKTGFQDRKKNHLSENNKTYESSTS